eukprot:TRINITY_DN302_c0_g1_i1.p1 TRINITY_DN302_c0_g1~~TRINITY_DN302_c0_g1_i1.p1  ORF type:complete len:4597 (+),score=418.58 TRINITY_DN302_c0_g1_i1:1654-13791(+)
MELTTMPVVLNVTQGVTIVVGSELPDPEPDNNQYVGFVVTEPAIRAIPSSGCVSPNETQTLTTQLVFGDPLTNMVINGPCTVNGYEVGSTWTQAPSNISEWTYTIQYTPALFDGDWAPGTLAIECWVYSLDENIGYNVTRYNDGNSIAGDTTPDLLGNMNCSELIICGDSLINGTEACDDGNLYGRDGCTRGCQVLSGWNCTNVTVMPSQCWNIPICGDGEYPEVNEECDDGNLVAGDGCSPSCGVESQWSCTAIGDPDPLFVWSRTHCSHLNVTIIAEAVTSQYQNRFRASAQDITVGEHVTIVINATLFEVTGNYSIVVDLPPGRFNVLSAAITTMGTNLGTSGTFSLGQGPTSVTPNQLVFDIGTISNVFDKMPDSRDAFGLEVIISPKDLPGNDNGDQLDITTTVVYDTLTNIANKQGQIVSTHQLDLVMANVVGWLNVTLPSTPADAGDIIDYKLTLRHLPDSAAPAFDILVAGFNQGHVVLVPGSVSASSSLIVAPGNSSSAPIGQGQLSVPYFLTTEGDMVIRWQTRLNETVGYNVASVVANVYTQWDLVGGIGGRVFNVSRTDTVAVINTPLYWSSNVNSTSQYPPQTSFFNPSIPEASLLEPISFVGTVTLREGTSSLSISSSVLTSPAQLEVVSATVTSIGANIQIPGVVVGQTFTPTDSPAADGVPDSVLFNLGSVVNYGDNVVDDNDRISVTVVARFREMPANTPGAISNATVVLDYTNGTMNTGSIAVEVVAPKLVSNLTLTGTVSGDAGDLVTATLTISHVIGVSSSPAFDIHIEAINPGGYFVPVPGSFQSTLPVSYVYGNLSGESSTNPTIVIPQFDVSATPLVIKFEQKLNDTVGYLTPYVSTFVFAKFDTFAGPGGLETNMSQGSNVTVQNTPTVIFYINRTSVEPPPTSAFSPQAADATVSEVAYFQSRVTLREGVSFVNVSLATPAADARLEVLSATVRSVGASISGVTAGFAGTAIDTNGDGVDDAAIVTAGTVTNAGDNVVDGGDVLVVEVAVRVRAIPSNVPGVQMNTTMALEHGNGDRVDSAPIGIDIVGPVLVATLTTSGVPVGGDAGDEMTFQVVVSHASNSTGTGYNITMTSLLSPYFVPVAGSLRSSLPVSAVHGNVTGQTSVFLSIASLPLGSSATFSLTGKLTDAVGYLTPTVSTTTSWSYQTSAVSTQGTVYSASLGATTASISNTPASTFYVNRTSVEPPPTSAFSPQAADATVSEVAYFQSRVTLREGVSFVNVSLATPAADARLEVLSATVRSVGASISGVTAGFAGTAIDTNGDGVDDAAIVTAGTVTNAGDNVVDGGDVLVVEVAVRVRAIPSNVPGVQMNTTMALEHGNGDRVDSAPIGIDIVGPVLVATLTTSGVPVGGDAGDEMTFQVVVSHASNSTGTGYNITMTSLLSPYFVPVAGSLRSSLPVSAVHGNVTGQTSVFLSIASLPLGSSATFSLTGKLTDAVGYLTPTVSTTTSWSYQTSAVSTQGTVYSASLGATTASISNTPAVLSLNTTFTSDPGTGSGFFHPALVDLRVGEAASARLRLRLREGQSKISVTLQAWQSPLRLSMLSAKVVTIGSSITGSALPPGAVVAGADSGTFGSPDQVVLDFGTVSNKGDNIANSNDDVTIDLNLQVLNYGSALSQSTNISAVVNSTSTTSAQSLSYDLVNPVLEGWFNASTLTNADAGDIVTFTVTLVHVEGQSMSDAHNITYLNLQSPHFTPIPGTVVSSHAVSRLTGNSTGDNNVVIQIDRFSLASKKLVIQYQARLNESVGVDVLTAETQPYIEWRNSPVSGSLSKNLTSTYTATVNNEPISFQAALTSTSVSSTNMSYFRQDITDVIPGELLTYQGIAYLREGTSRTIVTFSSHVSPSVLEIVSSSVTDIGSGMTSSALNKGSNGTLSNRGGHSSPDAVIFDFGTIVNQGDNVVDANDAIVVQVVARVLQVATTPGSFGNMTMLLNYTRGTMSPTDIPAETVGAHLTLSLAQNATSGDAGDAILFSGSIQHSPLSTADAHNVTVTVHPLQSFFSKPVFVSANGGASASVSGSVLFIHLPVFSRASPAIDFSYFIRIGSGTGYSSPLGTAPAVLTWNVGLANQNGTPLNRLVAYASNTTWSGTVSMTTRVSSTSLSFTDSSKYNPAYTDLVVGEEISWDLTLLLPEGVSKPVVVAQLPLGSSSFEITGNQVVSVGGTSGLAVGSFGATSDTDSDSFDDRIVFTLPEVTNPWNNIEDNADIIVLRVSGRPRSVAANKAGFLGNVTFALSGSGHTGSGTNTSHPYEILEPRASAILAANVSVVDAEFARSGIVALPNHGSGIGLNLTLIPDPNSTPLFRVNITALLTGTNLQLIPATVSTNVGTIIVGSGAGHTTIEIRNSSPLTSLMTILFDGYLKPSVPVGSTVTLVGNTTWAGNPGWTGSVYTAGVSTQVYLNIPGPRIANFSVYDPDDQDRVYSNDDVFFIDFAEPTNTPDIHNHSSVMSMFSFTQSLGTDVTGTWVTDQRARLTVVNSAGGAPVLENTTVTVTGNLRNKAETSVPSIFTSPRLTGNFGLLGPQIVQFIADDPDDLDAYYGNNDTYTIIFDIATNQPTASTHNDILNLLAFNMSHQNPGTELSGTWLSSSVLRLSVVNMTGASPPVIGQAQVRVRDDVVKLYDASYRYHVSTSLSPPISGDWGSLQAPVIVSAFGNDPDDGDVILSSGDTFRIEFNIPTNAPNITTKSQFDSVFQFVTASGGQPVTLGEAYTAAWDSTAAQRLMVTVVNATYGNATDISNLRVQVLQSANLRNKLGTSLSSKQLYTGVSGNWGLPPGPQISKFYGYDPDDLDIFYSNEDRIVVEFDKPTNMPPITSKSQFVSIFTLTQGGTSTNLGLDFSAKWISNTKLEVVINDVTNANPVPVIGSLTISTTSAKVKLNDTETSELFTTTKVISGNWGLPPGPTFEALYFDDPDDGDNVYSDGDILVMYFNMKTNAVPLTTKDEIDSLFTFSSTLGTDYSGIWLSDNRTAIITVLNTTGATPPPVLGSFFIRVNSFKNLNNEKEDRLASIAVGVPGGDFGLPHGPSIKALVCNDPDDLDAIFSDGDTITLIFDRPTNTPNATLQKEIDEWIEFTPSLGSEYTGAWIGDSNDTLTITILNSTAREGVEVPAPFWAESTEHVKATLKVSTNPEYHLKDVGLTTRAARGGSPPATGDWGLLRGPELVSSLFKDVNGDLVFNDGDGIEFIFSEDTNMPSFRTKNAIDTNFNWIRPVLSLNTSFAQSHGFKPLAFTRRTPSVPSGDEFNTTQDMGTNYTAYWSSPKSLYMEFSKVGSPDPRPQPGNLLVEILAYIQNPEETSLPVGKVQKVNREGPAIVSALASDPDNGDDVYSANDIVTVTFNQATSMVDVHNKTMVDELLNFNQPIGEDYSAKWSSPTNLIIEVLAPVSAPPDLESLTLTVRQGGKLQDIYFLSIYSSGTSPVRGDWGTNIGNVQGIGGIGRLGDECRTFWCMWWWLLLVATMMSVTGCAFLFVYTRQQRQIAMLGQGKSQFNDDAWIHLLSRPGAPVNAPSATPPPILSGYQDRAVKKLPQANKKKVLPVPAASPAMSRRPMVTSSSTSGEKAGNTTRQEVEIAKLNAKKKLPTRTKNVAQSLKAKLPPALPMKSRKTERSDSKTPLERTKLALPKLATKKSLAGMLKNKARNSTRSSPPPPPPSKNSSPGASINSERLSSPLPKLKIKSTIPKQREGANRPSLPPPPSAAQSPTPQPATTDSASQQRVVKPPPALRQKKTLDLSRSSSTSSRGPPPIPNKVPNSRAAPEGVNPTPKNGSDSAPRVEISIPKTKEKPRLPLTKKQAPPLPPQNAPTVPQAQGTGVNSEQVPSTEKIPPLPKSAVPVAHEIKVKKLGGPPPVPTPPKAPASSHNRILTPSSVTVGGLKTPSLSPKVPKKLPVPSALSRSPEAVLKSLPTTPVGLLPSAPTNGPPPKPKAKKAPPSPHPRGAASGGVALGKPPPKPQVPPSMGAGQTKPVNTSTVPSTGDAPNSDAMKSFKPPPKLPSAPPSVPKKAPPLPKSVPHSSPRAAPRL